MDKKIWKMEQKKLDENTVKKIENFSLDNFNHTTKR